MNYLNSVEQKMLDALEFVRDQYNGKSTMPVTDFQNFMGLIRDAISAGRNKQAGCEWGLHAGRCTCTRVVPGKRKP